MKNNKGFSVVELIVSFTLTMTIVVILFEIVLTMKDLYVSSVTKTELLNKQNLFTDYIYSDIQNYGLNSLSVCGDNCISLGFNNGIVKNLEWSSVSGTNVSQVLESISYGDYKINLISGASFGTNRVMEYNDYKLEGVKICSDPISQFVSITLPINHQLFQNQDFGIKLLYVYELGELSIALPISSAC